MSIRRTLLALIALCTLAGTRAETFLYATVVDQYDGGGDILKIDESGNASIWATTHDFDDPQGIALDSTGNVYVNDGLYVYKIDSTGTASVFGTAKQSFYSCYGLAIDAAGTVYATGTNTTGTVNMIYRYDALGNALTPWTLPYDVQNLTIGTDGALYGTSLFGNAVVKFDHSGTSSEYADVPSAWGITFAQDGTSFVIGEPTLNTLYQVGIDGSPVSLYAVLDCDQLNGIGIDFVGNIFTGAQVCDDTEFDQNYIYLTNPSQETTIFSSLSVTQKVNSLVVAVPEPSTYLLIALGLATVLTLRARRVV